MADLQDLLVKTSRTFALSIPPLPEPTRREVTIAYLLFRLADTFEDGAKWPWQNRVRGLRDFASLLERHDPERERDLASRWVSPPPIEHAGYEELLRETPFVMTSFWELSEAARDIIREHVRRTCDGMIGYVERVKDAGELQLDDIPDLQEYCYFVAGIVGEMLTELFLLDRDELLPAAPYIRERARAFGEGLQLTNILKDSADDATEGRSFLPVRAPREKVFAIAREDLTRAQEYVVALQRQGAPRGILEFTAMPVLLAWASLDKVEEDGPGAKISRPQVFGLIGHMQHALDNDTPIFLQEASRGASDAS